MNELPANLLSLKMIGNPMEQRAVESRALAEYRKPFVLHLSALVDLDKIEIVPAERMGYQGILRRGVDVNDMLFAKIRNDEIRRQGAKVQQELRMEIKREQGKGNQEIVAEATEELTKMDEMDNWLDDLSEMMVR